jgi:hypothetical protein
MYWLKYFSNIYLSKINEFKFHIRVSVLHFLNLIQSFIIQIVNQPNYR